MGLADARVGFPIFLLEKLVQISDGWSSSKMLVGGTRVPVKDSHRRKIERMRDADPDEKYCIRVDDPDEKLSVSSLVMHYRALFVTALAFARKDTEIPDVVINDLSSYATYIVDKIDDSDPVDLVDLHPRYEMRLLLIGEDIGSTLNIYATPFPDRRAMRCCGCTESYRNFVKGVYRRHCVFGGYFDDMQFAYDAIDMSTGDCPYATDRPPFDINKSPPVVNLFDASKHTSIEWHGCISVYV